MFAAATRAHVRPAPWGESLAPFLWYTSTILRSYSSSENQLPFDSENRSRPTRRKRITRDRNADRQEGWQRDTRTRQARQEDELESRKRSGLPAIPFEGPLPSGDINDKVQGTTMTPKELAIFQNLMRSTPTPGKKAASASDESRKLRTSALQSVKHDFPRPLRALAEEAEGLRNSAAKVEPSSIIALNLLPDLSDEWSTAVKSNMDIATSDIKLWDVLQNEILNRVALVQGQLENGHADNDHVLLRSLPQLLIYFLDAIRSCPGSPLGALLLPTLKKLGPAAFALAATTELYNEHMNILYKQHLDLDGIVETLSEMDKEVYEFDGRTQDLLSTIIRHAHAARQGRHGSGQQALWLTDRQTRALRKLERWSDVVEERVSAAALRKARESSADLG